MQIIFSVSLFALDHLLSLSTQYKDEGDSHCIGKYESIAWVMLDFVKYSRRYL